MMRIIPKEESDAYDKLLEEWWANLDSQQKHSIYHATQDLQDIPPRRNLCLTHYPTGKMGGPKGENPAWAICIEPEPCSKHPLPDRNLSTS